MATSENYLKFVNDYKNKIKDKISKKEIFNYDDFELIEEAEINKLLIDAFKIKVEPTGVEDLSFLKYLSELQKTNKDSLKKIEIELMDRSIDNLYIIQILSYCLNNNISIEPLVNFIKDLFHYKFKEIENCPIYDKNFDYLYKFLLGIKEEFNKQITIKEPAKQEELKSKDTKDDQDYDLDNKIKKEFPSFNKWKISLLKTVLDEFSKNSFEKYSFLIYNEDSDKESFDEEESEKISKFFLKKVYNNEHFFNQLLSDVKISNNTTMIGNVFDKIFFLIIKDKNLFDKYSYLLTSTSLNSGNFNYMNKLINLKRFIPNFDGIKKAISESKRPIPSKVFGLLFSLPINEINEVYSQKKKLIKTNLINLNNFSILKELYGTNNQILQLIISEYGKFAPSIEELLKDYLTNNSKTPESLYNEVFKKDPTYLNKIVSLIKYKAPYISEFNSLNIKSNAQNIQQYIKIKSRQTDLAALIHNQEINNDLVPMLFNNSKIDLKEPYIDNLISVINFSNNKKEKINKFIQIQNKFKQKGFNINIQEFLDQLKESEKYVDEFETNNLNPSPRFIQLFKELATNISYVEMSDQINNYIRIAEKKDPNLFKLELNFDGYEFKVLKDLDPTHFRIGIDTDCCQRIGGAGSEAAIDSFINSQSGVLVLYYNSNILAQSYFHFVPQDNGFILDNIEYNKTEVQKIDKNIKDNQSLVLTEIYKKYAELLKEKYPEIKYLKLGKEQTKILTQEFKESELEEDPRRFKVDDPYTDFDESDHVDLF